MRIALQIAKYQTLIIIAAATLLGLFMTQQTFAQGACANNADCAVGQNCVAGVCQGAAGGANGDVFGVAPIQGPNGISLGGGDLRTTVARIINVALSLLGIVAVVIILIGGFKWMTAGGADEKVGEARKLIFSGIIGLAIIMSAWAIAKFVINNLATSTEVPGFQQIQ